MRERAPSGAMGTIFREDAPLKIDAESRPCILLDRCVKVSAMSDLDILCKNAVDVIDRQELSARLEQAKKEKRPLRVKAGFDPSAPDIHLGHTVLLRKLRQFQDLGHKVIFIVGDFTAMVGDPTGQSKTRPVLTREQVEAHAKTYQEQAFKILDRDPKKIEIVRNSQWLERSDIFKIIFNIASKVTVDQLLVREDFDNRRKMHRPIGMHEMFYPLLQGYDSVEVKADIELGGTDQKFNLLMGREIQHMFGQRPQIVMTFPLLVGLDGTQKMSKSLGNAIAVNDSPKDVFGKAMSIPDALMAAYFDLLTKESGTEIQKGIDSAKIHPRDAKIKLAKLLTAELHGPDTAEKEASEFTRIFSNKENPQNPQELKVPEKEIWIAELLKRAGAAASTGEAKRLIEQGGVSIDGEKVTDFNLNIPVKKGALLKAGKKKFIKIV